MSPLNLCHHRFQQLGLFSGGGIDLLLQFVAQAHQLVDADDNAVLFGSGRQPNNDFPYYSLADSWN